MAQLRNVGQGQQFAVIIGPISASIMLLMGLIFALFGIKIWGFRRRLTFDRGSTGQQQQQQQQQQRQTAPRYAAYESQINGTDNAVHGVFRQRNIEEFESTRPSSAAGNRFITGSVPNLRLHGMSSPDESTIGRGVSTVVYRPEAPQASQRRRRREVNSANYEFHEVPPPPTRQPPAPPILEVPSATTSTTTTTTALPIEATVQQTVEPALELGIPNFDHFAEKYELISAHASSSSSSAPTRQNQLGNKDSGRYVKFDAVDDVPELLTPDDDHVGAAIAVTAVVHHPQKPEEPAVDSVPEPETTESSQAAEQASEQNDRAFVMEVIAGTPSPGLETTSESNLFTDLELPTADDGVFQRIRSTFELNEADILDFDQLQLPTASSPPGFGKNIEEDWENFENLDEVIPPAVTNEPVPEPNWAEHPNLENVEVEQVEDLFHEIELIEPPEKPQPPPYEAGMPPFLPDYEFLMHMENGKANKDSLPNYSDVVAKQEVTNIDDLYAELDVTNGETHTFDELCQALEIVPALVPPEPTRRAPPQPAPRISRPPVTLNVRGGNAPPLVCYQADELPGSSEDEAAMASAPPAVAPQPAKRKVRFDTENLQYYQSAEMPSSSESEDMELSSSMPKLFGSQVSKTQTDSDDDDDEDDDDEDDDDDDSFVRAISEHRSMTQSLRLPVIAVPVSNDTEA